MARMRFGLTILVLTAMLATVATAPASATIGWSAARAGTPVPTTPPPATPAARAAAAARQAAKMNPPRRRGVSALPRSKATTAPVRAAAAVPLARPSSGWRIQLGAYNSPGAARAQWSIISPRVRALGGFQPSYEPFGRYTRLRTGPFASRTEANRACAAARAAGQDCFPVRR